MFNHDKEARRMVRCLEGEINNLSDRIDKIHGAVFTREESLSLWSRFDLHGENINGKGKNQIKIIKEKIEQLESYLKIEQVKEVEEFEGYKKVKKKK